MEIFSISIVSLWYLHFSNIKHKDSRRRCNDCCENKVYGLVFYMIQHYLCIVEPISEPYQVTIANNLNIK